MWYWERAGASGAKSRSGLMERASGAGCRQGQGRARALGRRGAGNRHICARRGLRGCSKPGLCENDARRSRRLRRRQALAREHSGSDLGSVHRKLGKRRQNAFHFCAQALRAPLTPGSVTILITSGAALEGWPISGGYAGAKRMQMFLAGYAQKESDLLGLGIRFVSLAPLRIMPETALGRAAVEGYARRLGILSSGFVAGTTDRQNPGDVADAVMTLVRIRQTPRRRPMACRPKAFRQPRLDEQTLRRGRFAGG